jgi:hypothetical protein
MSGGQAILRCFCSPGSGGWVCPAQKPVEPLKDDGWLHGVVRKIVRILGCDSGRPA